MSHFAHNFGLFSNKKVEMEWNSYLFDYCSMVSSHRHLQRICMYVIDLYCYIVSSLSINEEQDVLLYFILNYA